MVSADTFESGGRRAAIDDRRDQYRSIPSSDRSNSVGAPHPEPASYAKKFSGKYSHRTITGGIGHNLPQEAAQAFAQAVVDVDGYRSVLVTALVAIRCQLP